METAKAFTSLELNVLKGAFSVPNYCPLSSKIFLWPFWPKWISFSNEYELLL